MNGETILAAAIFSTIFVIAFNVLLRTGDDDE
jgi:hypothetical protein